VNHYDPNPAAEGRHGVLILDTDLLTIIQFRRGPLYERIVRRIAELDEDVAVAIISFEE
jgi:hypothetical protein